MKYCKDKGVISDLKIGNNEQSSPITSIVDIRLDTEQENEIYEEVISDPFPPLDNSLLDMISKKVDSSGIPSFSRQVDNAKETCFLSYVPVYEIFLFQQDDVFVEKDIGGNRDVCYVWYTAYMSQNSKYSISLHKFQFLSSNCSDKIKHSGQIKVANKFEKWFSTYVIKLYLMLSKENNVCDRGKQ